VVSPGRVYDAAGDHRSLQAEILVRKKTEAELADAHQELERRVEERTAQWHQQITARLQAEVEFQTILGERNRISRELHDILEQGLAGVGLQIEAAVKMLTRDPDRLPRQLELVRTLIKHSQTEVRRSIWDLRSRTLERHTLSEALKFLARQMSENTAVEIGVVTTGDDCRLDEVVENNLYRIVQESITNALKHARPRRVAIQLHCSPDRLGLAVSDDGIGMAGGNPVSREGHFGLIGIQERAKRIGGKLTIHSEPGRGTTVRLDLPLRTTTVRPPDRNAKEVDHA
jgi:signal transduction histidine kinase